MYIHTYAGMHVFVYDCMHARVHAFCTVACVVISVVARVCLCLLCVCVYRSLVYSLVRRLYKLHSTHTHTEPVFFLL